MTQTTRGVAGENADANEYYNILGEEFIYGRMAGAVVSNNRFDGILANNFIVNKIVNDNNGSYTSTDEAAVQAGLLAADYDLRFNLAQQSGTWTSCLANRYPTTTMSPSPA
jgi:hypothetical protein